MIPSCVTASSTWAYPRLSGHYQPLAVPLLPSPSFLLSWSGTRQMAPTISLRVSFVHKQLTHPCGPLPSPMLWPLPPQLLFTCERRQRWENQQDHGPLACPRRQWDTGHSVSPDPSEPLFSEFFFCWRMGTTIPSFTKGEGKENVSLETLLTNFSLTSLFFFFLNSIPIGWCQNPRKSPTQHLITWFSEPPSPGKSYSVLVLTSSHSAALFPLQLSLSNFPLHITFSMNMSQF